MLIGYLPQQLGNRLRALAAAIGLSNELNQEVVLHWVLTKNFTLPFHHIFSAEYRLISSEEIIQLSLSEKIHLYTEIQNWHGCKIEAAHNRYLLSWLSTFHEPQQVALLDKNQLGHIILYTNDFHRSFSIEKQILALRSLTLNNELLAKIKRLLSDLKIRDIPSVHARGSDFSLYVDGKMDWFEFYKEKIKTQIGNSADFYLSSEDLELRERLSAAFYPRVRTRDKSSYTPTGQIELANPNSTTTEDAIVDLYLLSCTEIRVSHPQSSYAQTAGILRGVI